MPDDGISGRVVLITAHGAHVALIDVDEDALHVRSAELARSRAFVADVADPDAVERTVTAIEDRMGPIAICVSNAGVLNPAPVLQTLQTSDDVWRRTWEVNTSGPFHLARSAGRRMAGRVTGRG